MARGRFYSVVRPGSYIREELERRGPTPISDLHKGYDFTWMGTRITRRSAKATTHPRYQSFLRYVHLFKQLGLVELVLDPEGNPVEEPAWLPQLAKKRLYRLTSTGVATPSTADVWVNPWAHVRVAPPIRPPAPPPERPPRPPRRPPVKPAEEYLSDYLASAANVLPTLDACVDDPSKFRDLEAQLNELRAFAMGLRTRLRRSKPSGYEEVEVELGARITCITDSIGEFIPMARTRIRDAETAFAEGRTEAGNRQLMLFRTMIENIRECLT